MIRCKRSRYLLIIFYTIIAVMLLWKLDIIATDNIEEFVPFTLLLLDLSTPILILLPMLWIDEESCRPHVVVILVIIGEVIGTLLMLPSIRDHLRQIRDVYGVVMVLYALYT